ncbi:MAG: hypothetical protein COA82_08215 [Alkaliphilus sp.]|nr:MAG: hypothetical protein COA82_08215 [Alkaliphilus sp.]
MKNIAIPSKNQWNIKKISEVAFYQEGPGVRAHQYRTRGVKLLNVANLQKGKLDLSKSERYISEEEAYGKYNHFLVDEGDFIIACSGIKVEYFEKKMGFVREEHLPLCMNTSTMRFKVLDEKELDIKYLAYYMKTDYFKKQIKKLITGSAQLNFGPTHIKKVDLILPPLQTQKKIVAALDKAQEIIDARKKQIELLDELIKSVFYDMFGDPVSNPMGWEVSKLEKCAPVKQNKKKNVQGEVWLLNLNEIEKNTGEIIEYREIDVEDIGDSTIEFNTNNVLYSKLRPYLNKVVIPKRSGFATSEILPLEPTKTILQKDYFVSMLRSKEFVEYISTKVSGAKMPRVVMTELKGFCVPIPPIKLQNQFTQETGKIELQKQIMKQSLTEMEDNFNSIIQKAFKGELF